MLSQNRAYVLTVLFIVDVANVIDGSALRLTLQEIKIDLSLSDLQLGIVAGAAFALLYSVAGVVIARWADRGNRVTIISLTATVRSLLVMACAAVTSFAQMLLLRVGVGVGAAGSAPASQSLLADYFARAERPRANAIYAMGGGVCVLLGSVLTSWLNRLYGWRMLFMILGALGLVVAALTKLTLIDPRFDGSQADGTTRDGPYGLRSVRKTDAGTANPRHLREVLATLWSNATLRCLFIFWSILGFCSAALDQWMPAFFIRSHGLDVVQLGAWFGVTYGLGATVGPILGGMWASRYAANDERKQLRVAAVISCSVTILSACIYLVPSYPVAFGLLGLRAVATGTFVGPLWAIIQTLAPHRVRASAAAVFVLFGVCGDGCGSLATGVLSDALRAQFQGESLRYASLLMCFVFFAAACFLWRASRSVALDMTAMQEEHDGCRPVKDAERASVTVGC